MRRTYILGELGAVASGVSDNTGTACSISGGAKESVPGLGVPLEERVRAIPAVTDFAIELCCDCLGAGVGGVAMIDGSGSIDRKRGGDWRGRGHCC
jgi:hypothetical protein